MIPFRRRYLFLPVFLLLLVAVWYSQYQSQLTALSATANASPTTLPLQTPTQVVALRPLTATPLPSQTPLPPATPSPVPTKPPTATVLPTDTPTASATPTIELSPTLELPPTVAVDRTCPEPTPAKPTYDRYYLPYYFWPTPDPSRTEAHFWFAKPLPGGGRFLTTAWLPYGYDADGRYLLHNGVDSGEKLGTPVLAVADGTVVTAQSDENEWYGWRCNWYGHLVVIQLDQTWQGQPVFVLYGHVLNIKVKAGDRVVTGDQVAEVGFGGVATVPHLHIEVRVGSNTFDATRNPMLWIGPGSTRGLIVGRLVDPDGRPWQGVPLLLFNNEDTATAQATTWSYLDDPQHLIHPDEGWAENFLFADVLPGSYTLYTEIQGTEYRLPVQVTAADISSVEIVTEPFQEATATPLPPEIPHSDDTANDGLP